MNPHVRRAMHEALDLVLDALAADSRERAPKRRARPVKPLPDISKIPPETQAKAEAAMRRAGLL